MIWGALTGGALGSVLSLRWAIGLAAAGILLSAIWVALSVLGRVAGQDAAASMTA